MRSSASRTALTALATLLLSAAPAAAQGLSVALDQAERVSLRGSAADVVIGNPEIADVTMIDSRTLVITGKGQGTTSLLVFDRARRVLFDGPVSVSARAGHVAMVRGSDVGAAEEKVFTCYGVCTPTRSK